MTLIFASLAVAAAIVAGVLAGPLLRRRRRRRLRGLAFPPEWRRSIEQQVGLYRELPNDLRDTLEQHIRIFMAEKQFVACNGIELTEAMRLAIAAQACLLLLNDNSRVFDQLETILVYPSAFIVDEEFEDDSGLLTTERRTLSGQSWDIRRVILSWEDAQIGATARDGYNVVLHEFAHQLDHESGAANGAPLLPDAAARRRWSRIMAAEYEVLCTAVERDEPTVLDPYGTCDPAEFFAVATEAFFEQAAALAATRPALYAELAAYYGVDPAGWQRDSAAG